MGRIEIVDADNVTSEAAGRNVQGVPLPPMESVAVMRIFSGDECARMTMNINPPNPSEPAHSLPLSEVKFITNRELTVGEAKYVSGAFIFVEKDTLFGPLRAGLSGATFLLTQYKRIREEL